MTKTPLHFGVTLPQIKRTLGGGARRRARVRAARLRLAVGVRPPLRRAVAEHPDPRGVDGADGGRRRHRARAARHARHAAASSATRRCSPSRSPRSTRSRAGRVHRRASARAGSRPSSRATAARSRRSASGCARSTNRSQIMKGMWTQEQTSFAGTHLQRRQDVICEPKPARAARPILDRRRRRAGADGHRRAARRHLEQPGGVPGRSRRARSRRCGAAATRSGRDSGTIDDLPAVHGGDRRERDRAAKEALAQGGKVYGGHMGAAIEAHGIWGTPEQVIEGIDRHVKLGCTALRDRVLRPRHQRARRAVRGDGAEGAATVNPRSLASGLLLFTGVAHAAEWALRSHAAPMLLFGAIYFALGLWLRRAGKPPLIAGAAVPALGGLGGAQQLLAAPAIDPVLAGMVAIDAVVVVCCVMCLVRGESGASARA